MITVIIQLLTKTGLLCEQRSILTAEIVALAGRLYQLARLCGKTVVEAFTVRMGNVLLFKMK